LSGDRYLPGAAIKKRGDFVSGAFLCPFICGRFKSSSLLVKAPDFCAKIWGHNSRNYFVAHFRISMIEESGKNLSTIGELW